MSAKSGNTNIGDLNKALIARTFFFTLWVTIDEYSQTYFRSELRNVMNISPTQSHDKL